MHIISSQCVTTYYTVNGKVIEYDDLKKFLCLLFGAYRLDKVAIERSIDIVVTLDGSKLNKHPSFVMAGVKLVDIECTNLRTGGVYELMPCKDANSKLFYVPQMCRHCFFFKLSMGKESQKMHQEEFGKDFDVFNQASKEGQILI